MNTSLVHVPFYGTILFLVDVNGEPYTPMKPIVEGMGLDWGGQHKKITAVDSRWGCISLKGIEVPGDIQGRETLCMPLRKLPGWLMTIHPTRVKPEIREKIIQYQNECDDVLWKYWTEGHAINPRIEAHSPVQQHELQQIVARRAQDSGKLRAEIWSRFDKHFRIARYSQLPASRFEEAKTYLETLILKGRDETGFRVDSVSICYLPSLPEEDGTFSRKFGERVISALWAWSRETNSEPVHRDVVRGLDLLSRVMGRAATEMDEAAPHLALAEKYLKRWRTSGRKEAARTPEGSKRPKEPAKQSSVPEADPVITVELSLAVWKKVLTRLGIDPALPGSEIRARIESLN